MDFIKAIRFHTGMRRMYDIIFFAFLSSFIAGIENMFPRPLPYFRIGFSFIIILFVLDTFDIKELIILILIKNVSVAIVFAYIFTPPFYLGLLGGLVSVFVMKFMSLFKSTFSIFGISLLGALLSNVSQAFLSKFLFNIPNISFLMVPVLILSLISGSIVGIAALFFYPENGGDISSK